jgi:hypothetical protein
VQAAAAVADSTGDAWLDEIAAERRRSIAAAAATTAAESSRFARKEPRAQDLREYDGAAGDKLDVWLDELGSAIELYELNGKETMRFAVSRLRLAASRWWKALGKAGQAAIHDEASLAAALRARFQTRGRTATCARIRTISRSPWRSPTLRPCSRPRPLSAGPCNIHSRP